VRWRYVQMLWLCLLRCAGSILTAAMVTRELRRNLNRLVTNLNARLAGIVEEFNKVERDAVQSLRWASVLRDGCD
jgi:hypothetical protein